MLAQLETELQAQVGAHQPPGTAPLKTQVFIQETLSIYSGSGIMLHAENTETEGVEMETHRKRQLHTLIMPFLSAPPPRL